MVQKIVKAFLLTAALAAFTSACTFAADAEPMRIAALKGPTAMGMVQMMDAEDSAREFTIASAVDEIPPMIVKGSVDVAAVPANLASVLYNNTEGAVEVLAINTLGVLYIVENGDSINSVEDLRGKTIYASGKGATPEYALDYILTGNGIDPSADVTIEWKSEHAECLAALTASDDGIAMLPQPFVTTALMKAEGLRVALDLNAEWDALGVDSTLITGVCVARTDFVEQSPDAVNAFLDAYAASVEWVNANTAEAAALVGGFDIVPEPVAAKALPQCNIAFIEGEEMARKLSGYLQVLLDSNPKAVGGQLPGEDFYYQR